MTGPEHYREAERQLEWVNGAKPGTDDDGVRVRLDMAQVHATLAAAEATIAAATMRPEGCDEWDQATGRIERLEVTS